MLRVLASVLFLIGVGFLGSCNKEARTAKADMDRFLTRHEAEMQRLMARMEYWFEQQGLELRYIERGSERFVEWRKREFLHLRPELANFIYYNWGKIEALTKDVGRFYGYHVQNFPRAIEDILAFLHKADNGWRQLVMDIAIWTEYRNREIYPLREEIRRFYQEADWEVANLQIDLRGFLEWREREYERYLDDGRRWWRYQKVNWRKLEDEVARWRANCLINGKPLIADMAAFYRHAEWEVPRLVDDVWRFSRFQEREFDRLEDDLHNWTDKFNADMRYLSEHLQAFDHQNLAHVPRLIDDVERFFAFMEREGRPLSADVRRFWRSNIALGDLALEDLRRFYATMDEDLAELEAGFDRFISYGAEELDGLKKALRRYATDERESAFGDNSLPIPGDEHIRVFGDHTPSPVRTGNTGL